MVVDAASQDFYVKSSEGLGPANVEGFLRDVEAGKVPKDNMASVSRTFKK